MSGAATTIRPTKSHRKGGASIRWDRLARWAFLIVLLGVFYMYANVLFAWYGTWRETSAQRHRVERLQHENKKLTARRYSFRKAEVLEREARKLGMVRPGETPYFVKP